MNSLSKLLLLTLITLYCSLACSQDSVEDYIFDQLVFSGNTKTKPQYLLQNISCQLHTRTTKDEIEYDISQLRNLPSVANATYTIESDEGQSVLRFIIEERSTQLPIVNIGGITGNVWLGLGFIENNLKGNGNLLLAYYQITDGRHSFDLYYKDQRLLNSDWGYTASLRKWSSLEPLYFAEGGVSYLYDNNSMGLSAIRNFGLRSNIELGASYFKESYLQAEEQVLDNPPGPQEFSIGKFLTKLQASHNQVFYSYFYLKGYSLNLLGQNVYNLDDGTFFNSVELEGKAYFRPKQKPKLNIATRLRFALSTNNDSPFAPFVVDSRINIRGIGNRIDRGTAQVILNLEARRTIYHKRLWSSQVVVFSDLGSWRSPGGNIGQLVDPNTFRHFVGGGIRFAYQKVFGATFRLDYSVDLYNLKEKGLVFGLGQYF